MAVASRTSCTKWSMSRSLLDYMRHIHDETVYLMAQTRRPQPARPQHSPRKQSRGNLHGPRLNGGVGLLRVEDDASRRGYNIERADHSISRNSAGAWTASCSMTRCLHSNARSRHIESSSG